MEIANATVEVTPMTVAVAANGHLGCDVGGEEIILGLESSVYYGLNSVGARIWQLVQKPITVDQIADVLTAEYEVDKVECMEAINNFLQEMVENGLLELR